MAEMGTGRSLSSGRPKAGPGGRCDGTRVAMNDAGSIKLDNRF
jgi:hypothetical protein